MPRIKMKKAKEGTMSKRKSLNDAIYGDRAAIRGHALPKPASWEHHFDEQPEPTVAKSAYDIHGYLGGGKHSHSSHTKHESCHASHPALKLPGTGLVIYGGSCISPKVTDADVYIGFDGGMRDSPKKYPWNGGSDVFFRISDMKAPSDAVEFRKLVEWTLDQLKQGKKVHAGCIGGHGRTGTFFAALVSMCGEANAIEYVRTNYCKKAVESSEQVTFLKKHYKVQDAPGAKEFKSSSGSKKGGKAQSDDDLTQKVTPISGCGSIWGDL